MPICEVAKLTGYSNATVSRVLNGGAGVADATAARVRRAIEELGYSRSDTRRGRKPKSRAGLRHDTIALLMVRTDATLLHAPIGGSVLHGVEVELANLGINLIVSQVNESGRVPKSVAEGKVDGLLLLGYRAPSSLEALLAGYPGVWMLSEREAGGPTVNRVSPDNFEIGRIAARSLIELGHTRLAYLNIEPGHVGFGHRMSAFLQAADAAGVECDVLDVNPPSGRGASQKTSRQIEPLVNRLLDGRGGSLGVFVPRDSTTVLLHRMLQQKGVDLASGELDLISCDNDPVLSGLNPLPATIDLNTEVIARESVSLLMRLINAEIDTSIRYQLSVPPRLVRPQDQPTYASAGEATVEGPAAKRPAVL